MEVVRGAGPQIQPDWRALTITGRARSAIKRQFRATEKEGFIRLGRASVDESFARAGKNRSNVTLRPAQDRYAAGGTEDELFEAVGRGRLSSSQVLEIVFPGLKADEKEAASARRRIEDGKGAQLYVRGAGLFAGTVLHFGECCRPAPGDRIVGIAQPDKSVTVHAIDCPRLAEFDDSGEAIWRDLHWTAEAEANTLSKVKLKATIRDAPGVLGMVCTIVGEAGGNIVNLGMHQRHGHFFDVDLDVEVKSAKHLTNIAAAMRACPSVETVDRARDG